MTIPVSKTNVSLPAIGKADMIRFDDVAAVPIDRYTTASTLAALQRVICLITQTLLDATAEPIAALDVANSTGPTNLASLRSPYSHFKSLLHHFH